MISSSNTNMESPAGLTGPINLGNPREFTIRQLSERIISLIGSPSEMIEGPLPSDEPRQRQPDIREALSELRWTPRIGLEEGLSKTIPYFEQLRAAH